MNSRERKITSKEKKIEELFKESYYGLSLFSNEEINTLKEKIELNSKEQLVVNCYKRKKEIVLKPEEVVRQLYTHRLVDCYHYPKERIKFEYEVSFGREKKKADIVIFDKDNFDAVYIIVELKKPKLKDGKNQLKSYCNATGAPIAVWTNGQAITYFNRKDPNFFEEMPEIPLESQSIKDLLSEKFTLAELIIKDKISNDRKSLKEIIVELEDDVLANAGVDVFEEVFKLIFTKLYDEKQSIEDKNKIDFVLSEKIDGERSFDDIKLALHEINIDGFRQMRFRNMGQSDTELFQDIQKLFDEAKDDWQGVFDESERFKLSPSHLAVCVSSLQDVKLFNSNLIVVDEAFEYLISKNAKSEKGQFFTPRHVIDMCVEILNPKKGEYMIDTASGSCGFPVHTLFKMTGHLYTNEEISTEDKQAAKKIFGIDFDEKNVRIARTLNVIAGDGETNVLYLNTLDYTRWAEKTENEPAWIKKYGEGYQRLEKLKVDKESNEKFNFDLLMANPPFAGDIKEPRVLHNYDISFNEKGKSYKSVSRDLLFIERNLDFIRPGGRLALLLPQGRFNNISDERVRNIISEQCRIIAIIGLHEHTFKPHTAPKTSIIFAQKWDDELCPKTSNYPIFMAFSKNCGKNSSGDYIFLKDDQGNYKLDRNNHLIINHDLHSHDGELEDGIAEKFKIWAQDKGLSFT